MPWARFEDDYLGNAKLTTLSTAAIALDMAAIIYSARELRDGMLSQSDVQTIASLIHIRKWPPVADELMRARRWEDIPGGAFHIHDYLEYQPSRAEVMDGRRAAAARMRRARSQDVPANIDGTSQEIREKFNDPVPGPVPGPERSMQNVSRTPPNPPRKRRGRGLEFDETGPRYEQRIGSDGKREWVEVEA